jgi:hypothetical protein
MHHAPWARAPELPLSKFRQHRFSGITTVNNHRQIQLYSEIQLRLQHRQLLIQVLVSKQIETELANSDDPGIIFDSGAQNINGIGGPMLRIKRMNSHGVTHFREAVG